MEDEGAKNKIINDGKIILKPQLFTTASKTKIKTITRTISVHQFSTIT